MYATNSFIGNTPFIFVKSINCRHTFTPTSESIRISISGTSRFALTNLSLDRDNVDTLISRYEISRGYRYGFQAQEKDDEVSGAGNSYTAEFWQYSPRIGRRWNTDPVVKDHESPYATFANNPIWFIDPNGADSAKVGDNWFWKIESGNTYNDIAKRTGVGADNLEKWNTQDPLKLEIGSYLNLSNNGNVHFVYETKTPNIYLNTIDGLALHPEWTNLTYMYPSGSEGNRANRSAVCPPGSCSPGTSCDEFPYASTQEGGYGASTMCVPTREQNVQGGQLSGLYRTMNIGERFTVIPVPDASKKQPSRYPVLDPAWKPKESPKPSLVWDPKKIPQPVTGTPMILPAGRLVQAARWILAL